MIVVSGAPQSALTRFKKEDGVHLLGLDERSLPNYDLAPIFDSYVPTRLTHEQYPALIPEDASVSTVANRALLVAYNWPENSARYLRLAKFVDTFFDRIYQFHNDSRHPKWKEINVSANVPGWTRFKPAADWLTQHKASLHSREGRSVTELRPAFDQFGANYIESTGKKSFAPRKAKPVHRVHEASGIEGVVAIGTLAQCLQSLRLAPSPANEQTPGVQATTLG
jgi:hypothetical protein